MKTNIEKTPTFREALHNLRTPLQKSDALWEDARFILADVPLNRKAVEPLLPFGMKLTKQPLGTVFIVDYKKTAFTVPYKEAALLIHVRTLLGTGLHCPWMIVDDDTALVYGRELLGYPKKMGEISFIEEAGGVKASVKRRGVELMTIEATLKDKQPKPEPVFSKKTFNVTGPGQLQLINLIWMFRPRERIHESFEAEVKLNLTSSEYDPIAGLIEGDPQNGRMVVLDILKGSFLIPAGLAGPRWYVFTHTLRYR